VVRSASDCFLQAAAVLMIARPASGTAPLAQFLQTAFRFTSAEAAIALSLCDGHDIGDIGRTRVVRPSTVRAQVKSMLAKTSTRRQAELVALLAHCASVVR
jgi:DNA-binding NarL/FixJ family response regulator